MNSPEQSQRNPEDTNASRRRILKWAAGGVVALALAAVAAVFLLNTYAVPVVRARLVRFLEARYRGEVRIADLSVKLLPQMHLAADQVVIRRRDQPSSMPAFIEIHRLNVYGSLMGLLRWSPHIDRIELEGLRINIPPRKDDQQQSDESSGGGQGANAQKQKKVPDVVVGDLIANGTVLRIYSRKPGKYPLEFSIERLAMQSVGINQPMKFQAKLQNATPPGLIDSDGTFGPWNTDDLGLTPVSGKYTFRNADLSVYRGISGILASDGAYHGALGRLEVDGWTDTPDFAVGIAGHRIRLRTDFHAVVDGTNGDTRLEPVTARLPNSTIVAVGSVANQPAPDGTPTKGKTVTLHVTADGASMEDILQLAMKSAPPLTGTIHFDTQFELPPGDKDVAEKLYLKGSFSLDSARFRDKAVQEKIRTLSLRGRGINKKEEENNEDVQDERVVSNVKGDFLLRNGVMTLPQVSFHVPGAAVHIRGNFGLLTEKLNFKGELRLDAKVSETTSGIKSLLLKSIDPLFHHDGAGAVIPIHINGTRDKPDFGVDMGRVFRSKKH